MLHLRLAYFCVDRDSPLRQRERERHRTRESNVQRKRDAQFKWPYYEGNFFVCRFYKQLHSQTQDLTQPHITQPHSQSVLPPVGLSIFLSVSHTTTFCRVYYFYAIMCRVLGSSVVRRCVCMCVGYDVCHCHY